jgi:GATA-binding protein
MKPPPTTAAPGRPAVRSAPSGIAQLRQSVDRQAHTQSVQGDAMNLDDFIQPSSVGSPAGLLEESPNEMRAPSHATAPAIPIRKPNQSHDQNHALAHASAPPVPPIVNREHEFGYVQRHVRKTSIDERRVSPVSPSRPPLYPANCLSAPQAASRGLSSGSSREQHHDAQQS